MIIDHRISSENDMSFDLLLKEFYQRALIYGLDPENLTRKQILILTEPDPYNLKKEREMN